MKTSLCWARLSHMSRLSTLFADTALLFAEDFNALLLFAALPDWLVLTALFFFSDEVGRASAAFFAALPGPDEGAFEESSAEGALAETVVAFTGTAISIHATTTASMEGQREYFMIIPWLHSSRLSGECRADHARGPDPGDSPMTVEAPCAPDRSVSLGDAFS